MEHEDTILQMAADIAVIKSRCEALPELEKRVRSLEDDRVKMRAYASAWGAVGALLLWIAQRLHIFLPALVFVLAHLLSGCALPVAGRPPPRWAETSRPVRVLIDSTMDAKCLDAAEQALSFWADYVDYLVPDYVSGDHPAVNGLASRGEIGIEQGVIRPGTAGNTSYGRYPGTDLAIWANITLARCDRRTAIHELGHALGLGHEDGTVMCWSVGCYVEHVTPAQAARVR